MSNHVVSFSGGRTSAYFVWLVLSLIKSGWWEKNIGGKVYFIFMDTSAEHPKTYKFIREVVGNFGIELVCLQGDFDQPVGVGHSYKVVSINNLKHDPVNGVYGQMMRKYGVPTIASPWCTSRMKEEVHDKYCDDTFGKGNYTTWLGIRSDEPKRIKLPNSRGIRYMAELSDFDKEDVLQWWEEMPFNLEIDEHLGNCVFCFKKSHGKVALAARDEPDLLSDWERSIDEASDRLNKPVLKYRQLGHFEDSEGNLIESNDYIDYEAADESEIFDNYKIKWVNGGIEFYIQHIPKGTMYRNNKKIDGVIAMFKDLDREHIRGSLKSMKRYDAGACSESCEAFGDLFSED